MRSLYMFFVLASAYLHLTISLTAPKPPFQIIPHFVLPKTKNITISATSPYSHDRFLFNNDRYPPVGGRELNMSINSTALNIRIEPRDGLTYIDTYKAWNISHCDNFTQHRVNPEDGLVTCKAEPEDHSGNFKLYMVTALDILRFKRESVGNTTNGFWEATFLTPYNYKNRYNLHSFVITDFVNFEVSMSEEDPAGAFRQASLGGPIRSEPLAHSVVKFGLKLNELFLHSYQFEMKPGFQYKTECRLIVKQFNGSDYDYKTLSRANETVRATGGNTTNVCQSS